MKTAVHTLRHLQETAAVWWLLGMLIVLILGYLYFVNDAVRNVVSREKVEREIAMIGSRLAEIEFEYVTRGEALTMEYAISRGYLEVGEPIFISRETSAPVLSFNNEI